MEIEEEIINEAIREREAQSESLLNGAKHTITRPDGTQYRPYARILIQPTIVEVARQYMRSFFERQGVGSVSDDPTDELVRKLNGELSAESKAFLGVVIMSAFLEGGIFCACGRGVARRESFVKLAQEYGAVEVKSAPPTQEDCGKEKQAGQLNFEF